MSQDNYRDGKLLTQDEGSATELESANAVLGITAGTAVTTDAAGTIQQYLRGIVKILADVWTDAKNAFKVWQGTHDDLCANANLQVNDTDVSTSNAVPVQEAPFTTIKSGEVQGNAAATQLPSIACRLVRFKACISNTGNVYLGAAGVTKPDGTTDATTGIELLPGDDTVWIPTDNLNRFYLICDNATDDLTYLALA